MPGNLGGCVQPFDSSSSSVSVVSFTSFDTSLPSVDSGSLCASHPARIDGQLRGAGAFSLSASGSHSSGAVKLLGLSAPKRLLFTIFFVLVAGTLLAPLFLVSSQSFSIPEHATGLVNRIDAVLAAQGFTQSLFHSEARAFLAAESGSSRTIVIPFLQGPTGFGVALPTLPPRSSFEWKYLSGVSSNSYQHCAVALAMLSAVSSRSQPSPARPLLTQFQPVHNRGPDLARLVLWSRQVELAERADFLLRQRLEFSVILNAALSTWIDRVGTGPLVQHLPIALRDGDDSSDVGLRGRPFSSRFSPTTSIPLLQPVSQLDSGFRPRGFKDMLEQGAIDKLHSFFNLQASNLAAIRRFGIQVRRIPNAFKDLGFGQAVEHIEPLVIGQDEFLPAARGIIWDCRELDIYGFCSPLDYSAPPNSDLNRGFILHHYGPSGLFPWPDQELISQVVNGVQFQANLPLQIVLLPHLVSLPLGFSSVEKEIVKFLENSWYQRTDGLPFLPIRSMGQGAASRKSEPLKFRRTTDGGGPRRPIFDRQGVQAVSFNDAIGLHDLSLGDEAARSGAATKWPASEVKPRIEDLMHDSAVLRHAGSTVFREPLVGFTDDFARYFTQFPVHTSELWKTNLLWSFPLEVEAKNQFSSFSFVTEKRLGFGLSLSPSIAQRFSELVLADFRTRLDAEEDQYFDSILSSSSNVCSGADPKDILEAAGRADGMTAACRWIQQRRFLSRITNRNELRLYSAHLYTDDLAVVVVGHARLIRALRCWGETTSRFGLVMAPPTKRQLGSSFTWLGFNFHLASGVVVAQPDKISRARDTIELVLSGAQVTFDAYRSLMGLMEHLLPIIGAGRPWMYHLYEGNYNRGMLGGPTTRMFFSLLQKESLRRWLAALTVVPGCKFSKMLRCPSVVLPVVWKNLVAGDSLPPVPSLGPFSLFSDAASEDLSGGLGGWLHGDWWFIPLTNEDRSIFHITSLELAAAAINIIIFGPRLKGFNTFLYADATTTVHVLFENRARSATLQVVHELLLARPEYQALSPTLRVDHIFGEANIFADAASRNRPDVLRALALQIGSIARQIQPPKEAISFLEDIRFRARILQRPRTAQELEDAQQRGFAWPSTYTGDGPGNFPSGVEAATIGKRPKFEERFPLIAPSWPSAIFRLPSERQMRVASISQDSAIHASSLVEINVPFSLVAPSWPPRPSLPLSVSHTSSIRMPLPWDINRAVAMFHDAVSTQIRSPFQVSRESLSSRSTFQANRFPGNITQVQPRVFSSSSFTLGVLDSSSQQLVLAGLSPVAQSILHDTSSQALRPSDPSLLLEYDSIVGAAVQASVAPGTLKKNLLARKRWIQFTSMWGTPPLRDDDPQFFIREAWFIAAFLVWLSRTIRGKGKRTLAKPQSLMGMVYGVARDHHLHGRRFDCLHFARLVVKALNDNYIEVYGSLSPKRREPFSGPLFRQLLRAVDVGIRLRFREIPYLVPGSWFYHNFRAAAAISRGGGFRRGEVSLSSSETFSAKHLSWASLFFIIGGVYFRYPSTSQLLSMSRADEVGLLAGPCKNDRWGIEFGAHPVYLPFDPHDAYCVGTVLRDFTVNCRPPLDRLRVTPLLSCNSVYSPLRHHHLDDTLELLLVTFLSEDERTRYSWHSFRIGLACALLALGASDATIMALVRWRSTAALRVYCRFEPHAYAAFIDAATQLDSHSLQGPNLPALPTQKLPFAQPPVPGALPRELYQLLAKALSPGQSEPDQMIIASLASQLPEIDADSWVLEFSKMDMHRDPGEPQEELSDEDE